MTNKRVVYPIPEAVDDKPHREWQIQPSQQVSARVYPRQSLLIVPLDNSPQSRMIRNHELGHIRWSPPRPGVMANRMSFVGLNRGFWKMRITVYRS